MHTQLTDKERYDYMLYNSGMFWVWNPEMKGVWDKDKDAWLCKYGMEGNEEIQKNSIAMKKRINELENAISTTITDVQRIQVKIEEIVKALSSAVEQGNQLHIGIVLGQSIQQLSDIAHK